MQHMGYFIPLHSLWFITTACATLPRVAIYRSKLDGRLCSTARRLWPERTSTVETQWRCWMKRILLDTYLILCSVQRADSMIIICKTPSIEHKHYNWTYIMRYIGFHILLVGIITFYYNYHSWFVLWSDRQHTVQRQMGSGGSPWSPVTSPGKSPPPAHKGCGDDLSAD